MDPFRWLACGLLAFSISAPVEAQISEGQFETDLTFTLSHAFDVTDFSGNLRAGRFLDTHSELEIRLGFAKVNRAGQLDLSGHYLFHPPILGEIARPYALAGVGVQTAFVGGFHFFRPTLSTGVGGKFFHSRRVATRAELLVQRVFATGFSFTQVDFLAGFSVFFGKGQTMEQR